MRRRAFVVSILGLLAAPFAAGAQPAGKAYRIGYLSGGSRQPLPLTESLRELGYTEGHNLVVEQRYSDGNHERLPTLMGELLRLDLDLIVTQGTPAAIAAKRATSTVPVLFMVAFDPVQSGLVTSLAHPGGNLTGFTAGTYEDKHLEILKDVVPKLRLVAYLLDANYGPRPTPLDPPSSLGLKARFLDIRNPDSLDSAFATASRERAGAILVENTPMLSGLHKRIADLAVANRLPAISHSRDFAELGGLLAYGPERRQTWLWPRLALQVVKILKGANPADLPVEQPTKFELVVNLKTAKALGLTIPPSVLARADEVIE
jgi:putative ABC transport system substrate-binding protein